MKRTIRDIITLLLFLLFFCLIFAFIEEEQNRNLIYHIFCKKYIILVRALWSCANMKTRKVSKITFFLSFVLLLLIYSTNSGWRRKCLILSCINILKKVKLVFSADVLKNMKVWTNVWLGNINNEIIAYGYASWSIIMPLYEIAYYSLITY